MPDIKIVFELLNAGHDVSTFSCGDEALDLWLYNRALRNQTLNATRIFLAVDEVSGTIMGYYGLSMSEIIRADAPKPAQRNMPEAIPVVLLGRLAVSKQHQKLGLGRFIMRHVLETSLHASEAVAARLIITQPIDANARNFYLAVGFEPLAQTPDTLCLDLRKIKVLPIRVLQEIGKPYGF